MKTKTQLTNRILSLVLAFVMVMGMLPMSGFTVFAADESYDLWVGGKQVTSTNCNDVLGDGKVSYDPATKTLTLNGATIDGAEIPLDGYTLDVGIFAEGSLTLELLGSNVIKNTSVKVTQARGIYVSPIYDEGGDLTIKGDGSLDITAGDAQYNNGILATSIALKSGDVTVTGGDMPFNDIGELGFSVGVETETLTVTGGSLKATGGAVPAGSTMAESYGIWSDAVTISGGETIAQGETRAFNLPPTIAETHVVYDASGAIIETPVWTGDGALTYAKIAEKGYAITISASENGTVEADKTTAPENGTVTLTVSPHKGYLLDTLMVGGTDVTAQVVNNTYTFTMPAEAVTVGATFTACTEHAYGDDGICTVCDAYQPAELVEDVYQIGNSGQFFWFAQQINGGLLDHTNAVLTDNINLENKEWTPIGTSDCPYSGHFDGRGHTVSGLCITSSDNANMGLFGKITSAGVRNLTVSGSIDCENSDNDCGLLIANMTDSVVYNSYTAGSINVDPSYRTGGLVGYAGHSVIINSGSSAAVHAGQGTTYVGGLVGYMTAGTDPVCLLNSYSTGSVTGGSNCAGGLVGYLADDAVNNYFSGTFSGSAMNNGVLFGQISNGINLFEVFVPVIEKNYYISGTPIGFAAGLDTTDYAETYSDGADLLNKLNSNLEIVEEIISGHRGYLEASEWAQLVELLDGASIRAFHWRMNGGVVHCGGNDTISEWTPNADGLTHSGECACGTTVTATHNKVYSVDQDTNTIRAVCDTCRKVSGSASLKVPEFAYYTNSSVFSAAYGSSFENGEEIKLTYDDGSETAPSSLGVHTATLTVYEGGEVKASVSAQYEITYLPAPENPYNISGGCQVGDTHWFKDGATVMVTAPSGYTVSTMLNGTYGDSIAFSEGDKMVIYLKDENGAMTDAINVEGVRFDENAPTGKITVTEQNFWEKLLNKITFGLFFRDGGVATVTYSDIDSGVKSVEYYVASEDLIADAALDNAAAAAKLEDAIGGNWKTYSAEIALNQNAENVVYVKITDNVGNVTYVSSEGIVIDSIAPKIYGIENGGVYYGDKIFKAMDDNFLKIELDGVDITNTTEGDDEFEIVADNAEHTVTVTDEAGNKTEYKVTVYKNYTVTFKVDSSTIETQIVGYGKDAAFPKVPAKDGYVGKWDRNNENITSDTVINAVYTEISAVKPDEVKPEDKADLEDTKKQLEDMLNGDGYTEDDKKVIQEAIDAIDDALEVICKVEAVEELIDKLPDTIKKDDEAAIKAADDAYNALPDYEKSLVDKDVKKALDDAKAALAELNKPVTDPNIPQTGDNSHMDLWIALLFISGGAIITLTVVDRKRKMAAKK